MGMKLRNTSHIGTEKIREIIRFVKPAGVNNLNIRVRNTRSKMHGHAGGKETSVSIGKPEDFKFPYTSHGHGAYLNVKIFTFEEVIVYMFAHELRHNWQTIHPKGWRYYGSKGQYSERDADCYALHMLREWRRK